MDRYDPYTDKFLRDTQYNIHGTNLAEVGTDCISRQQAIDKLTEYGNGRAVFISVGEAVIRIEQLPSAQPEIIRCEDCIMHGLCRFEQGLGLDGYCSQAERRTNE